jgi:hypothetical protein
VHAQDQPGYFRDRGPGIPTSMFGTYVRHGEWLVMPFYEHTRDRNREYQPKEFGLGADIDYRGRFHSDAAQVFVAYGVNDWLALEFEAAYLSATLHKSPADNSAVPPVIREKGITDIEGQVRARLMRETTGRPELFFYAEVVAPTQTSKLIISEPDFDLKPGLGVIKGFGFGTLTGRINLEWTHEERKLDLGELSVEYLRRISNSLVVFLDFEGGETGALDEWETVQGIHLDLTRSISLRFDNSIGLSSKASDWVPQVGVMFSFGP